MAIIEPDIDPYAMLPEETVYGRNWAAPKVEHPAPLITAQETFEQGWCWWPNMVLAVQRKLIKAGYEVRIGFSRGYKKGATKDSFVLLDTIGVWGRKAGKPRVSFTWTRGPDSATYEWKATVATFQGHDGYMVPMGHLAGKRLL